MAAVSSKVREESLRSHISYVLEILHLNFGFGSFYMYGTSQMNVDF